MARQQIEAGKQFRRKVEAYWEGCEEWADRELEGTVSATASEEEAEKRGSKLPSKTRSRRKSKPS